MAISQTIQWIALPNGVDAEGRLRLSVSVAPRLRTDEGTTLALFPDFVDWAALMRAATFEVEQQGGPRVIAERAGDAPDPNLWRALFGEATPLKPFVFEDLADRPVVTFPAAQMAAFVRDRYTALAATTTEDLPDAIPDRDANQGENPNLAAAFAPLVDALRLMYEGIDDEAELDRRMTGLLADARGQARARRARRPLATQPMIEPMGGDGVGDIGWQMNKLLLFHRRTQAKPVDFPPTEADAEALWRDRIDFHRMLSALGDYPALLRRLGLAFDLLLPGDALPLQAIGGAGAARLRVIPAWASAFPASADPNASPRTLDYTPWTQFGYLEVQGRRLFVATDDGLTSLLPLAGAGYELLQLDVDGALLKMLGTAVTLQRQLQDPDRPLEEPGKAGAPALRTGGIALLRSGNARRLHEGFYAARRQNHDLETNPVAPMTLKAGDLVAGYRVDIADETQGRWFSLHERNGTYDALDFAAGPFDLVDEGFSQLSVTGAADMPAAPADPDGELYVHEGVITWDGWSLAAPRPGASISRDPRAPDPAVPESQPARVENRARTDLRLETRFRPRHGSLPRLRFGRDYRLRVRSADLGGNSLTLAEADDLLALLAALGQGEQFVLPAGRPLTYARFEPVDAPVLVARREFSAGESLDRAVIRSNFDRDAVDYAAQLTDLVAGVAGPYFAACDRHVAAPKAALQMVEAHGLLDAAIDAAARGEPEDEVRRLASETYAIATRESGSFNDPAPGARFVRTSVDPGGTDGYMVHDADQVALPYLPDPLSGGAVLRDLPGLAPGESLEIAFDQATGWYDAQPFRLRLEQGEGRPEFDAATRVLTVRLPAGRWARARVNSLMAGSPELMALYRWCLEAVERGTMLPFELDRIAAALTESRHWMFTPWRELTLVHAVQQPLQAPELTIENGGPAFAGQPGVMARNLNATAAYLAATARLDAPSTAQVDLLASWREPQDDPAAPQPLMGDEMPALRTQVLQIAIPDQDTTPFHTLIEPALSLRDEQELTFDASLARELAHRLQFELQRPGLDARQLGRLKGAQAQLAQVTGHEFGDTKYRRVSYRLSAASRYREYFPAPIIASAENVSRTGQEVEVDVLSSAPPKKPAVKYLVPLLRWEETGLAGDPERTSVRRGGGLRVYLDRPWFSSGDGELLAAVIQPGQPISPLGTSYPYVSYWGQDPAWRSASLAGPAVASFRNATRVGSGLRLPEAPSQVVTAVGFTPGFDEERRLWYCDIEIDTTGAYFPFVRLALARYQPRSIPGAELSPVVLADFMQTLPDRALSVVRAADGDALSVTVSGPAPSARRSVVNGTLVTAEGTNAMVASIEERDLAVADETLGWRPMAGSEVTLAPSLAPAGTAAWAADVPVPAGAAGRLRLVVREFEPHQADHPTEERLVAARRLVYVDVMEI